MKTSSCNAEQSFPRAYTFSRTTLTKGNTYIALSFLSTTLLSINASATRVFPELVGAWYIRFGTSARGLGGRGGFFFTGFSGGVGEGA